MKNTLLSFVAAAAAVIGLVATSLPAQAQPALGSPGTVWSSANYTAAVGQNANILGCYCGTNNLSLNTNVVDVSQYRFIGLGWRSQLTTSGTTTNTVIVEKSIDGNWWDPFDRITTTSSGTTFVGYATNYTIDGIAKLRVTVVTSAAGTAPLTNSTVAITYKHGNQ